VETPDDGRTEPEVETLSVVEVPGLGTVRVVKLVVVTEVVVVESVSSPPPLEPVGLGGLAVTCAEVEGTLVPSVIGQTVVLTAMVSVVTWPILPGQSVTVAAQLVMVYVVVVYTVDVVQLWEAVVDGTEPLSEVEAVELTPDVSLSVADGEAVSVAV
jgi:hypothetical protein